MNIREKIYSLQDEMLNSLQQAIEIPSVEAKDDSGYPFGNNVHKGLLYFLEVAKKLGFTCVNMDDVLGYCEYGDGEEMVMVLGHIDVVPEGDGWSVPPYEGTIKDGRIYGRGTMDDKGPLTASLYALYVLKELKIPLKRKVRILFGTNEETGSQDIEYYLKNGGETPAMGFTPDGEYPLINGEKGIINVCFSKKVISEGNIKINLIRGGTALNVVPQGAMAELLCDDVFSDIIDRTPHNSKISVKKTENGVSVLVKGVSAHGSTPQKGENAIGNLLAFLCKLPLKDQLAESLRFLEEKIGTETDGKAIGVALEDDISGKLTLNMGVLTFEDGKLTVKINYRYPVKCSYDECAPILDREFFNNGFIKESELHKKSLYVDANSALVKGLLEVYMENTQQKEASAKCIGGGTYAKAIPNVVAFGPVFPGDEIREHKADEYMEIFKLMENAVIYAEAIRKLAN